ncbi:MAG: DNA methyltransferase [Isosphaeraceae bacterium]
MAKKRYRPAANAATLTGFSPPPQTSSTAYSGDKPNPHLRAFIESKSTPYDPATDTYDVPAFNQPIETTKASALYNMHVYWSKKPHQAIRQYIRHYTKPGDIVLDPFCGSGGTAISALLDGRKAIAIDRSPAATFIAKNHCTPVDTDKLREAFQKVKRAIQAEINWLYETRCDRCGGKAMTGYTVYSQVFQCPRCLTKVPLYDCGTEDSQTIAGKAKVVNVCPDCQAKGFTEVIRSQSEKFGFVPVKVVYHCEDGCKPTRDEREHNDSSADKRSDFKKYDLAKIEDIDSKEIPHWHPRHKMMNVEDDTMPWGAEWREGRNFRTVAELFTKRNLWALSAFRAEIRSISDPSIQDAMLFGLTGMILNVTRMCKDRGKLGISNGTYYLPQVFRELVVFNSLDYKFSNNLYSAFDEISEVKSQDVCISTQSATNLPLIPPNSIDYIFTDPPYAENVQYGELNFIWEAWLDFDTTWHNEEIIVNEVRGKSVADWEALMKRAMTECFRVLKPGRWLSLCYHDTSEGTWALVQDIMAEVGFIVDKAGTTLFIDTGQKSYNQLTADKTTKRDLVLNFRKPKVGEYVITRTADGRTFAELGSQVIRNFLTAHPGATKDRIYDELVSRLVRTGKMEAHDFNALLRSVAEEVQEPIKENLFDNKEPDLFGSHVSSRWYLKETGDQVDTAEQAREDAAAGRLEAFMAAHLRKHPEDEGVHYSDLFEQYLPIPIANKPRRLLADWLPEYFSKTPAGTWRPPADAEERAQKAALRQTGTLRRIKRFANALIEGVPVRDKDRPGSDVDLLDWLRQCRRAGLHELGKAIYEKGGLNLAHLSDEQQIEAEDDYRICVRRGSDEAARPKKRPRKMKQDGDE